MIDFNPKAILSDMDGVIVNNLPKYDVVLTERVFREQTKGMPYSEICQKAHALPGVTTKDCWVTEDALAGIKAAKVAGQIVAGITTTHQATELDVADTDLVIDDFNQLLALWKES